MSGSGASGTVAPAGFVGTLHALLFRPGQLTRDASAVGRPRLAPALALFLTCVAAFFGAVQLAGAVDTRAPGLRTRTAADSAVMLLADSDAFVSAPDVRRNVVVRLIGPGMTWTLFTHQAVLQRIVATAIPRAAVLLVPFFAALTLLAWPRDPGGYAHHLAFALHVHAAWFLALAVPVLAQPLHSGVLAFALSAGLLAYTTWYTYVAARVALGGTTRDVGVRLTLAGLLYLPAAMAVTLTLAILAIRSL